MKFMFPLTVAAACACVFTIVDVHAEQVFAPRLGNGRAVVGTDRAGNAAGAGASSITGPGGGTAQRAGRFNRSADGSIDASAQASSSGQNGSASRSGSFNRDADGNATGSRTSTATNSNTGNTFNGSTTYTKGEGVTRSGSCTDSSGNTVTCGQR